MLELNGLPNAIVVELAVAHVHGHHRARAALEQAIGEAAGRGAHVEASAPLHGDAEIVERTRELLAAARGEARSSRAHANLRGVVWNAFERSTAGYSIDERIALFGGTAARVYRLNVA